MRKMEVVGKKDEREDRMLELIEHGKTTEILIQKKKTGTLNKLQRYGLIEISDTGFHITEKGRIAMQVGVKAFIQCDELERKIAGFTLEKSRERADMTLGAFLVLVFCLLVVLTINVNGYLE